MAFTNQAKNSSSFSNGAKHSSVFRKYLRHGKVPTMTDLSDFVFTDTIYRDDNTQLKDFTFSQLSDATYTNQTKN